MLGVQSSSFLQKKHIEEVWKLIIKILKNVVLFKSFFDSYILIKNKSVLLTFIFFFFFFAKKIVFWDFLFLPLFYKNYFFFFTKTHKTKKIFVFEKLITN